MKKLLINCLVASVATLYAQENSGYNPNSVRPIHSSDIMFKKTLTRAIDLREKQNKSLFSCNREITRIIIDAVRNGKLIAYASDSLDRGGVLTSEQFFVALSMPNNDTEIGEENQGYDHTDSVFGPANEPLSLISYYSPSQLYQLEITEDYVFDKNRSRAYCDIQSLTIMLPAEFNIRGFDQPLATFKYKDLVRVFKQDPRAIWFNPENDQEHRNMADAFDLRLFSSYIIRVSNPDNLYLSDIYSESAKQSLMASYWETNKLMEFEHHLWEY